MISVGDVVSTISPSTCDFGTYTYIKGTTASTKTHADLPSKTMDKQFYMRLYLHAYMRFT